MIKNEMLTDTEACLCWALGKNDNWLIKQLIINGIKPGEHSKKTSMLKDFPLVSENNLSKKWLFKFYLVRGDLSRALDNFSSTDPEVEETMFENYLQKAIEKEDPGIFKVLDIYPRLSHACACYACMFGKIYILKFLSENNQLLQFTNNNYFVDWAITRQQVETVKYLLHSGWTYTEYNHQRIESIWMNDTVMIQLILNHLTIPQIYLEKGLIIASEHGKLNTVRLLLDLGIDPHCENNASIYRAIAKGHIEVYYLLLTYASK